MNQNIQEILEDLYRIEPELRKQEPALLKLVETLLASRPDAVLDEVFRKELRERLLREFPQRTAVSSGPWSRLAGGFANRWTFAAAGAVLGALVIFAVTTSAPSVTQNVGTGQPAGLGFNSRIELGVGAKIERAAAHAFGPLLAAGNEAAAPVRDPGGSGKMAAFSTSSAQPQYGYTAPGADASTTTMPAPAPDLPPLGLGGGGGVSVGGVGPAPERMPIYRPPVSYRFDYPGELQLGDARQVDVLKRSDQFDSKLLAGIVSRVDLGLMDLGRLQDLKVQNVSLAEDRDFGYFVNINFDDGSINISQNWNRWPQPYVNCVPGADCSPPRLTLADMPADDAVIAISDAFLKELGISTADYGAAEVDHGWRQYYDTAENQADYWFPDQITVQYPLVVNGLKVYNSDGRFVGLMVGIDVRNRRVANVSPIYIQNYSSSAYDAQTDAAKVKELISRGGIMPFYSEGAEKVIDLSLGEPEQAYYSNWIYANGVSENILVPALVFPIKDQPADQSLYLEKVVVPLAKELYDQPQGGGVPVPYLMKGAVTGSAGSAEAVPAAESTPAVMPEPPLK